MSNLRKGTSQYRCACVREGTWPRQHVTRPTGVAETKFDEDPEAEEAAVASAQGADSTTPISKGAPDRHSSVAHEALDGVCSASPTCTTLPAQPSLHNPPCLWHPLMTLTYAAACVHTLMVFFPSRLLMKQVG